MNTRVDISGTRYHVFLITKHILYSAVRHWYSIYCTFKYFDSLAAESNLQISKNYKKKKIDCHSLRLEYLLFTLSSLCCLPQQGDHSGADVRSGMDRLRSLVCSGEWTRPGHGCLLHCCSTDEGVCTVIVHRHPFHTDTTPHIHRTSPEKQCWTWTHLLACVQRCILLKAGVP